MLIDDLIVFCNIQYQENHCTTCSHKQLCSLNCKQCLDDLHFHSNCIRSDYNCEHLLDYYVCRYSYKYCSEVIYALESVDLSHYPYFNILSLGCGGAPDLMAFNYMGYNKKISYRGLDKNACWEKIHNRIEKEYNKEEVRFYREIDALHFFEHNTIKECNVIVIEYLISFFFCEIGEEGVKSWFAQLTNKIVQYKPFDSPLLIIINDVDSINTGRDTFLLLKPVIEGQGLEVSFELRKRFKEQRYYEGSTRYQSKANKFQISDLIKDAYNVAITCESAQLILEVK